MTVLATYQRSRIECDACRKSWVFVDGALDLGLRNAGWSTGDRHLCPPCVRAVAAGQDSRSHLSGRGQFTGYAKGDQGES